MSEQKPTKKEHYIPRFYLNQFSLDEKRIFELDVLNNWQESRLASIYQICCEDDLYELRDNSGEITSQNLIEKLLHVIETEFSILLKSIDKKLESGCDYRKDEIINEKDEAIIVVFIVTMILRTPDILKLITNEALKHFNNQFTDITARNFSILSSFPFYKKLDENDENLLKYSLRWFENLKIKIGFFEKDVFWTSDRPVIMQWNNRQSKCDDVIFPLSSRMVLHMFNEKSFNYLDDKVFFKINPLDILNINKYQAMNCRRWIFSKSELNEKQIELIKNIKGC